MAISEQTVRDSLLLAVEEINADGGIMEKQIEERNDNLDIAWLRDTEGDAEEGPTEPDDIAAAIIGHLKAALGEIEELSDELEGDGESVAIPTKEAAE